MNTRTHGPHSAAYLASDLSGRQQKQLMATTKYRTVRINGIGLSVTKIPGLLGVRRNWS